VETTFKMQWQALRRGQPGKRFQARYRSGQKAVKEAGAGHKALRIFRLLVALGCVVVGVVLVFIPGPAILFFLIAGGLLSAESIVVARFLDWAEVKLRAGWTWSKRHWKKLPLAGKIGVMVLAAAFAGAGAYAVYRFVTR
jgi:fatty acid desaturase